MRREFQPPTVDSDIKQPEARQCLQDSVRFIAHAATLVGQIPASELMLSPVLHDLVEHFNGINDKLYKLAGDPIPF